MPTELAYMDDSELYEMSSNVVDVRPPAVGSTQTTVVLDSTVFYPQGGGQPTDLGTIDTGSSSFDVERVSFADGEVLHQGILISGSLSIGEAVTSHVDPDRRRLHARLHTGGHVVMTAMDRLLGFPSVKGYHFPDGPYVEFEGTVPPEDRDALLQRMQELIDQLVNEDSPVTARFESVDQLRASGVHIPTEMPAGKPTRVVLTAGYLSPCGGTHVKSLGALRGLKVRGIKSKSGNTRVSYTLEE